MFLGFCCWLTPIPLTVLCVSTCSDGLLDFHKERRRYHLKKKKAGVRESGGASSLTSLSVLYRPTADDQRGRGLQTFSALLRPFVWSFPH